MRWFSERKHPAAAAATATEGTGMLLAHEDYGMLILAASGRSCDDPPTMKV